MFEWIGAVYYLLAGVLVGNVWEAGVQAQARPAPPHRPEDVAGTGLGARHRGLT